MVIIITVRNPQKAHKKGFFGDFSFFSFLSYRQGRRGCNPRYLKQTGHIKPLTVTRTMFFHVRVNG